MPSLLIKMLILNQNIEYINLKKRKKNTLFALVQLGNVCTFCIKIVHKTDYI